MSVDPKPGVIVTCGPGYEPIDEVRRITNQSTGELGHILSSRLAREGWEVLCLRGTGATHAKPAAPGIRCVPFGTNDELLNHLRSIPHPHSISAIFHAAALCDFRVKQVSSQAGPLAQTAKIPSRAGELTITLEPAVKVIGGLRTIFPKAKIVGWKYELAGTREEAIEKGRSQIGENRTAACVVNGKAFGKGFGFLEIGKQCVEIPTKETLSDWLTAWLGKPGGAPRAD